MMGEIDEAIQKFKNDPVFNRIVNVLHNELVRKSISVTDLRLCTKTAIFKYDRDNMRAKRESEKSKCKKY
jgi:hypothetical protein